MEDIINISAQEMLDKSLAINSIKVRYALFVINRRLRNVSDRELQAHNIFVSVSELYNDGEISNIDILIKEIEPFLIDKGYGVKTNKMKADNIDYISGISIRW